MTLKVKFWGTRGSVPCPASAAAERVVLADILRAAEPADIASDAAIQAFIDGGCRGAAPTRYGGETSCVEIRSSDGARLLIDFGSGARAFATESMRRQGPRLQAPLDVLLSHLHWDHIQGFPFFGYGFVPGNRIRIHGCHEGIEDAFRRQMSAPFFPVPFDALGAEISFERLSPGRTVDVNGFSVTPFLLPHAGDSYAYRIEREGRSIVYASDGEHKPENVGPQYPYVDFIRGADILIFDAQYSLAETVSVKEDWGHSSNVVGVELGLLAGVRELVFFHHEPLSTDAQLDAMVENSRRYKEIMREARPEMSVTAAWDGLEMVLS